MGALLKMKPHAVCCLMVGTLLVVMVSGQSYTFGAGRELGRLGARLQSQRFHSGLADRAQLRRDSNRFDGFADQKARWAGKNALRDKSLAQSEQALQRRAQNAGQNFGRLSNNFANIAKQIRDEALRNQYVIKDDARYQRNNLNSAQGSNAANARKTAFDKGETLKDNINYTFNKKFDSSSSENGGFEEENGRNLKKLNLIDEREKDRKLLRGDSEVSRAQSDQKESASNKEWKSNAAQKQTQDGKYGFADRKLDQAGERSDDRAVDYDRKDSRFLEQETGRDEAVRLAKDLAEQLAGYNNKAEAAADANRAVADKKYYGGKELGKNPIAGQTDFAPDGTAAAPGLGGDKAKHEGSGGAINTGFDENAAQHEKGNELAAAKALSSAQAVNDYQRNKDKLAYDQRSGLQDRSQGQFKQGLQDASSEGFSGNSAEAAKASSESDRNASASKSASNLDAKEKSENEALRDRNYFRKVQNDDSETFTRRKQFYHNKKEGGNNDEKLNFNREKNARRFGAADEADLSKQNTFKNLNQDGKVSSQVRNFEDLVDRRASLQHENEGRQGLAKGFDNRAAKDEAQAQIAAKGYEKALSKASSDDSQSSAFNRRQSLQDTADTARRASQDNKQGTKDVAADIEYIRPSNGNPLGDISASDFVTGNLLRGSNMEKGPKEHNIPDIIVNIKPIEPPPKVVQPKRQRPLPPLPEVQQVKAYHPPKYTKPEVNYNTGRATRLGNFNRPTFSRINPASLFQGPRRSTFVPNRQATPKSRFTLQRFGAQGPATSNFARGLFGTRFTGRRW